MSQIKGPHISPGSASPFSKAYYTLAYPGPSFMDYSSLQREQSQWPAHVRYSGLAKGKASRSLLCTDLSSFAHSP